MTTRGSGSGARKTSFVLAAIASLGGLLFAGCSAEAEDPAPRKSATAGRGALETSAGTYEFTPTTCAIYKADGVDDIEIQGLGTAPDGENFHFELSSTGNAVVIELGVDGPFASSERKLQAGKYVSQEFTINVSGNVISVPNLVLVNENGQSVDAKARLGVNCDG